MVNEREWAKGRRPVSDVAVEGLLAGFLAGGVMALVLLAAGLASGHAATTVLSKLAGTGHESALTGTVTHLAVTGVYGALFGVICCWIPVCSGRRVSGWLIGLLYGLLLWLVAIGLPRGGVDALVQILSPLHLALGYLLYGASLGWAVSRSGRR
ncbi:MAG: hypothetical protein DCC55_08480 [Chloroflexi bacterium]|nr:MAG: hypothetical protein DCC55_08480 [Chloroflexota bacterium]